MKPWTPTTDLMMLRRMGKLGEELGELIAVKDRCIIQGIDEVDPSSGKVNRQRLEEEIADVLAQLNVTIQMLRLNTEVITNRQIVKEKLMAEWEALFSPQPTKCSCGYCPECNASNPDFYGALEDVDGDLDY